MQKGTSLSTKRQHFLICTKGLFQPAKQNPKTNIFNNKRLDTLPLILEQVENTCYCAGNSSQGNLVKGKKERHPHWEEWKPSLWADVLTEYKE